MLLQESPAVTQSSPHTLNTLTAAQLAFYRENGFLRIERVFTPEHMDALSEDLDWMIEKWAFRDWAWTGPWRQRYMDAETEKKSQLIGLHDMQYYSRPWMEAVTDRKLCGAMADILGPVVELHHSTLHVKPPETGHPFPMHQDWAFYQHADGRYVDVLVHVDDTRHENGEIRFLAGSHKNGPLEHVTKDETGKGCTPHLPVDQWSLKDTVPVPAKRGDVVIFNIFTVHGSYINTTERNRRLVRVGYKDPANIQSGGQSMGRPNLTVWGRRPRREGGQPFSTEIRQQPGA